jgi:TP901 family phage tail tape measure protein
MMVFGGDATPLEKTVNNVIASFAKLNKSAKFTALIGVAAVGLSLNKARKEFIKFEREMAEIGKLVGQDLARPVMEGVAELSRAMPLAREEISEVAATAARLGIRGTDNIIEFTKVAGMMGVATNISAGQAADALARMLKQMDAGVDQMLPLGSAINELSNTMATSASEIVASARRATPELSRLGLTGDQIVALAASLNEVSESATRAGTRLRRFAQELVNPKKYEVFADALGLTVDAFVAIRDEDPEGTMLKLIEAMARGGVAADILAVGLDTRVRQALQAFAQNLEGTRAALIRSKKQYKDQNSLLKEYAIFADTASAKAQILRNRFREVFRGLGMMLGPTIHGVLDAFMTGFDELTDKVDLFGRALDAVSTAEFAKEVRDALDELEDETFIQKMAGIGDAWQTALANGLLVGLGNAISLRFLGEVGGPLMTEWRNLVDRFFGAQMYDVPLSSGKRGSIFEKFYVGQLQQLPNRLRPVVMSVTAEIITSAKDAEAAMESLGRIGGQGLSPLIWGFEALGRVAPEMLGDYDDKIKQIIERHVEFNLTAGITNKAFERLRQTMMTDFAKQYGISLADAEEIMRRYNEESLKLLAKLKLERDSLGLTRWEIIKMSEAYDRLPDSMKLTANAYMVEIQAAADLTEATRLLNQHRAAFNAKMNERRDYIDSLQDEVQKLREGEEAWRLFNARRLGGQEAVDFTKDIIAIENINAAIAETIKLEDKLKNKQEELEESLTFATFESKLRLIEKGARALSKSIFDTIDDLIEGEKKLGEAFVQIFRDTIRQIAQTMLANLFVMYALKSLNIGGGGTSGFQSLLNTVGDPVPGFAKGGSVEEDKLAVVGEKGPELFVPRVPGDIIPNNMLQDAADGKPDMSRFAITTTPAPYEKMAPPDVSVPPLRDDVMPDIIINPILSSGIDDKQAAVVSGDMADVRVPIMPDVSAYDMAMPIPEMPEVDIPERVTVKFSMADAVMPEMETPEMVMPEIPAPNVRNNVKYNMFATKEADNITYDVVAPHKGANITYDVFAPREGDKVSYDMPALKIPEFDMPEQAITNNAVYNIEPPEGVDQKQLDFMALGMSPPEVTRLQDNVVTNNISNTVQNQRIDQRKLSIPGGAVPRLEPSSAITSDRSKNVDLREGSGGEMNVVISNNFNIQALDGADVKRVLAREREFITGLTLTSIDRSRALKGGR